MELVDVVLTPLQRRNRSAFVTFEDLGRQQITDERPQRALEIGERVVLHDDEGEYFGGTVVDTVQVTEGVDSYLIRVGVRLPEEWALLRVGKASAPSAPQDPETGVTDVLDMLDALRAQVGGVLPRGTIAAQRQVR